MKSQMSKRLTIFALITLLLAMPAFGRFIKIYDTPTLIEKSSLVFVGKVQSVTPSGIYPKLSYPTWEKADFEWLKVEATVLESIKGTTKSNIIQIMLLSLSYGPTMMINGPGMLQPKKDQTFLFYLLPTDNTNFFASVTSPYDDNLSIFPLDRSLPEYQFYREGTERKDLPFYERHDLIWHLVDNSGQILHSGVIWMRETYAKSIAHKPSGEIIYLQREDHPYLIYGYSARTNTVGK